MALGNKSTLDLIDTVDPSTPTGIQLSVKSADDLHHAMNQLESLSETSRPHFKNIRVIDLNFGCPSKDVIGEGGGPALLKRRTKLYSIFRALVERKRSSPWGQLGAVGAKIRLGLNQREQSQRVYLGVVEAANLAGLDYLTVHARNASQRSRDDVTWSAIREVKEIASMPVIGNGNVRNYADMCRMRTETGCDAVMLARAAIANPWVFRDLQLCGMRETVPAVNEVDEAASEYMQWAERAKTKLKYLEFHRSNFSRLRSDRLETLPTIPQNAHMS